MFFKLFHKPRVANNVFDIPNVLINMYKDSIVEILNDLIVVSDEIPKDNTLILYSIITSRIKKVRLHHLYTYGGREINDVVLLSNKLLSLLDGIRKQIKGKQGAKYTKVELYIAQYKELEDLLVHQ